MSDWRCYGVVVDVMWMGACLAVLGELPLLQGSAVTWGPAVLGGLPLLQGTAVTWGLFVLG